MTTHCLERALAEEKAARQAAELKLQETVEELRSRRKLLWSVTDQLGQQTAQLNVILDNTLAGIVLFDDDLYVLRANHYAEAIFGFEEGGLFGAAASDLVAGTIEEVLVRAAADGGKPLESRCEDYFGKRKDGSLFPAEISIANAVIKKRNHSVWFVRDITERKRREAERDRLERELRQAQKLESLGTLASGIAHEINSPIQFVGDNLQFLQQGFQDLLAVLQTQTPREGAAGDENPICFLTEEIPVAIAQSLEGISRVSEIVISVRDFSHPGSKERMVVDLNRAVESTVTISRNQWKYVAALEMDLDPDLPEVCCVPGEINQVILNLIVNAAQAIEEAGIGVKGLIRIATWADEDHVSIEVSDTGCGVPRSAAERIFDPFFTTKEVGKGTGQGLSLAHQVIVHKHQGKLFFEPAAGGGTTFTVQLPLTATSGCEQAAGEAA